MLRNTLDQRGLPPKEKGEAVEPLISIIVPVYNVLPYLQEALDSAVHQTWKNLEILIIDDGSTDGSGEVCDEYLSDPRVKVIHQENKGLSGARNTGLDLMTGEYVAFLDPDDAYHPEKIERLFRALAASHADLAVCGYDVFVTEGPLKEAKRTERYIYRRKELPTGNKILRPGHKVQLTDQEVLSTGHKAQPTGREVVFVGNKMVATGDEVVLTGYEASLTGHEALTTCRRAVSTGYETLFTGHEALQALAEGHLPFSVWNKLYSRRLWDNLRYPERCVYEDIWVTPHLFEQSKLVAVVSEALVYYRMRRTSITETNTLDNTRDSIKAYKATQEYLEQVQPPLPLNSIQTYRENALRAMISHWVRIQEQENALQGKESLKDEIRKYAKEAMPFQYLKTKVVWWLFLHCPEIMIPIQKSFRRMKGMHERLREIFV